MLTGEEQMYPLSIFSVSHAGKILDVTSQTACHSGDEDVLQVDALIFSSLLSVTESLTQSDCRKIFLFVGGLSILLFFAAFSLHLQSLRILH